MHLLHQNTSVEFQITKDNHSSIGIRCWDADYFVPQQSQQYDPAFARFGGLSVCGLATSAAETFLIEMFGIISRR